MSDFEKWTLIAAGVSVLISIGSLVTTFILHKITTLSARRMHSIELFKMWENVCEIDKDDPIGVDIINAIHAIEFTAIYYNYKILDRAIINDLYRKQYIRFYDLLQTMDIVIPGTVTNCRDSLGPTANKAYKAMKEDM